MSKSFRAQLVDIDAKIAKLQAQRAEIAAKADSEVDFARVEQGTIITFEYGRAEKRRTLTGVVMGRKGQDKGPDLLKVRVGEGFEAEIVQTLITSVTQVGPVAEAA